MNEQQFIRDALAVLNTVSDDQFDMELCYEVEPCGCVAYHMAARGLIPLKQFDPGSMIDWLHKQGTSPELLLILGFSRNSEAYYKVSLLEEVTKEVDQLTPRRLLRWFRKQGYLNERSKGRVSIYNDQSGLIEILHKDTREPLFALIGEYI